MSADLGERDRLAKVLRGLRCLVSGHQCGTDTVMLGAAPDCAMCATADEIRAILGSPASPERPTGAATPPKEVGCERHAHPTPSSELQCLEAQRGAATPSDAAIDAGVEASQRALAEWTRRARSGEHVTGEQIVRAQVAAILAAVAYPPTGSALPSEAAIGAAIGLFRSHPKAQRPKGVTGAELLEISDTLRQLSRNHQRAVAADESLPTWISALDRAANWLTECATSDPQRPTDVDEPPWPDWFSCEDCGGWFYRPSPESSAVYDNGVELCLGCAKIHDLPAGPAGDLREQAAQVADEYVKSAARRMQEAKTARTETLYDIAEAECATAELIAADIRALQPQPTGDLLERLLPAAHMAALKGQGTWWGRDLAAALDAYSKQPEPTGDEALREAAQELCDWCERAREVLRELDAAGKKVIPAQVLDLTLVWRSVDRLRAALARVPQEQEPGT